MIKTGPFFRHRKCLLALAGLVLAGIISLVFFTSSKKPLPAQLIVPDAPMQSAINAAVEQHYENPDLTAAFFISSIKIHAAYQQKDKIKVFLTAHYGNYSLDNEQGIIRALQGGMVPAALLFLQEHDLSYSLLEFTQAANSSSQVSSIEAFCVLPDQTALPGLATEMIDFFAHPAELTSQTELQLQAYLDQHSLNGFQLLEAGAEQFFLAKILTNQGNMLLIEPAPDSREAKSSDQIWLSCQELSIKNEAGQQVSLAALLPDQILLVGYDGLIAETYPGQINKCSSLTLVSAKAWPGSQLLIEEFHDSSATSLEEIGRDEYYIYYLSTIRSNLIKLTLPDGRQMSLRQGLEQNEVSLQQLLAAGQQMLIQPLNNPLGGYFNLLGPSEYSIAGNLFFPDFAFMYIADQASSYFDIAQLLHALDSMGYKQAAARARSVSVPADFYTEIAGRSYIAADKLNSLGLAAQTFWEVNRACCPTSFTVLDQG